MPGKFTAATAALVCLAAVVSPCRPAAADFSPWGPLVDESWIVYDPADPKLALHTANLGDYAVGFDQAKNNNAARGMNALKFACGGQNTGRLVGPGPAGSFELWNTGGKSYSDLLLLVAIDAAALPGDFSLAIGPAGEPPTVLGPGDFGWYDPAALGYDCGRPTGLYGSVTDPPGEPLTYDFSAGMVTIYAVAGQALGGATPSVTFDYAFANLPAKAVFNAYALIAGAGWIYHTNRGIVDNNDPAAPVSTFEVLPEPTAAALLALAAAVGIGRQRRRTWPTVR